MLKKKKKLIKAVSPAEQVPSLYLVIITHISDHMLVAAVALLTVSHRCGLQVSVCTPVCCFLCLASSLCSVSLQQTFLTHLQSSAHWIYAMCDPR